MAAIVAGKKCDKLLGVGVGGAERQVGLPARLQRKTAIFALKVAKTARKSRNSSERRERMHCFLKGRILPPRVSNSQKEGKRGENCLVFRSWECFIFQDAPRLIP